MSALEAGASFTFLQAEEGAHVVPRQSSVLSRQGKWALKGVTVFDREVQHEFLRVAAGDRPPSIFEVVREVVGCPRDMSPPRRVLLSGKSRQSVKDTPIAAAANPHRFVAVILNVIEGLTASADNAMWSADAVRGVNCQPSEPSSTANSVENVAAVTSGPFAVPTDEHRR